MDRRRFLSRASSAGAALAAGSLAGRLAAAQGAPKESASRKSTVVRPLQPPKSGPVPVAFMIGDNVNVIDTAGPWEVFQDVMWMAGGHQHGFELFTVAKTTSPLKATGGLVLIPNHTYDQAPAAKVIVVPAHQATPASLAWLNRVARDADLVMSVCTGAFILARAGLLDGLTATTHHDYYDDFESEFRKVKLQRGLRFVEHDRIATAGGLTSGIDLALRVVERYYGRERAQATATYMEYESRRWLS